MSHSLRTPWITLLLVAIAIPAGYAATWIPDLITRFGFDPHNPTVVTVFTGLFLHANALHLLGNLLALVAVGSWVESATGSLRFLILYFVSGLCGVALHWVVMHQVPGAPVLVGASGCAAGLTAYGTVRYMWSRVVFGPRLKVPVVVVGGIWLMLQILGAFVLRDRPGGVSFWAHLGGAAAGLVLAIVFGASTEASLHKGRKSMVEMGDRSPAAQLAAAESHLEHHPLDAVAWREVAEAQADLDHVVESSQAWIKVARLGSESDRVAAVAALHEHGQLALLSSVERCQWADQLVAAQPETSRLLWTSVATSSAADTQRPFSLLALATRFPADGKWLQRLVQDHPDHEATDIARRRGLTS